MKIEDRKAAYTKFVARVEFVKDLAEMLDIPCDENGNLVITNHLKEVSFYEMLNEYDENVRHFETMNEGDRLCAEAEANAGVQALRDDE